LQTTKCSTRGIVDEEREGWLVRAGWEQQQQASVRVRVECWLVVGDDLHSSCGCLMVSCSQHWRRRHASPCSTQIVSKCALFWIVSLNLELCLFSIVFDISVFFSSHLGFEPHQSASRQRFSECSCLFLTDPGLFRPLLALSLLALGIRSQPSNSQSVSLFCLLSFAACICSAFELY